MNVKQLRGLLSTLPDDMLVEVFDRRLESFVDFDCRVDSDDDGTAFIISTE